MRAHRTFVYLIFLFIVFAVPQIGSASRRSGDAVRVEKRYFSVNGELYHLTQKRNSRGVVTEQILLSKKRIQIAFDYDGDGTWDSWESHTPERRIIYYEPENGHFTLMKAEYPTEEGLVELSFVRGDDGQFHLYWKSLNPKKYRKLVQPEDIVVGCVDDENLHSMAVQINDALARSEEERNQIIRTIFDKIVDNSCKTDDWMGSKLNPKNPILQAIFEVFNSDRQYKDLKPVTPSSLLEKPKTNSQPMYLGCLRQYGFHAHAARISAALHTYHLSNDPFEWKITCRDAKEGDPSGIRGEYVYRIGLPPDVSFVRDLREPNNVRDQKKEDYAKTFFHEMLHYSLIRDEVLVSIIEDCCSQTRPDHPQCERLREEAARKLITQKYRKVIAKSLREVGPTLAEIISRAYGDSAGDQFDRFVNHLALATERALEHKACQDENGRPDPTKFRESEECRGVLKAEREKVVDWMFSEKQCEQVMGKDLPDPGELELYCQYLKDLVTQIVTGKEAESLQDVTVCPDPNRKGPKKSTGVSLVEEFYAWFPWRLLNSTVAFAQGAGNFDEMKDQLCRVKDAKINWSIMGDGDWSPGTGSSGDHSATLPSSDGTNHKAGLPDVNPSPKAPNQGQMGQARQNAGNSNRTRSTHSQNLSRRSPGGSSTHVSLSTEIKGPPTFDYSDKPTLRALKISESLRIENEAESRIKRYIETAYQRVVPEARAKSRAERTVADTSPNASKSLRVPDPFTGSARFPASVAITPTASGTRRASIGLNGSAPRAVAGAQRSGSKGEGDLPDDQSAKSSAKSGGGRGVAGLAKAGASPSPSPSQKAKKVDRRALNAFLRYMQNLDRASMKLELKRPSVLKSLDLFAVAVIDDEGYRYGPVEIAQHWLIFNHQKQRLVLMTEDASP